MAFQATPNGVKVEFNGSQNGVPVVNVWHVKTPGTVSTADLDDIVVAFLGYWAELRASISNTYVLNDITATDISVDNGQQLIFPVVTDNAGTVATAGAAGNAAACVSLRTAYTGRSFRGRTYVGGLPQAALQNAQLLTTTAADAYADAISNLIDGLTSAGQTLCVLSRWASGVLRVTGLLTEIIAVICDTKIDSQRRRTAN